MSRRLVSWNPPPFPVGELLEEYAVSDIEELGRLVANTWPDRIVMLVEDES